MINLFKNYYSKHIFINNNKFKTLIYSYNDPNPKKNNNHKYLYIINYFFIYIFFR